MPGKVVKLLFVVLAVISVAISAAGCKGFEEDEPVILESVPDESFKEDENVKTESQAEMVYVDISGEVRNPGVYQVSEGTRVFEVIACAGGMTEEAAAEYINQAEMVYDGQKIVVPNREEAVSFSTETENSNVQGKVNLNTATKEELMTLPGIGNSKAENIIEYRKSNGRFSSAEELKNVEGIKDGIFNKIKERITVS